MIKKRQIPHYEFLQTFDRQKQQPAYNIIGSEVYLVDQVLQKILDKFKTPGAEEFDFITFYGDVNSGSQILEQLEMLPFLAKHKPCSDRQDRAPGHGSHRPRDQRATRHDTASPPPKEGAGSRVNKNTTRTRFLIEPGPLRIYFSFRQISKGTGVPH